MGRTYNRLFGILISASLLGLISISVVGGHIDIAEAQGVDQYLISPYSSYSAAALSSPGSSEGAITVVDFTSITRRLCEVTTIWRDENGGEVCRITSTRLLPHGTERHCSRLFQSASGFPVCAPDSTCPISPEKEGSILVQIEEGCLNQIAVNARVHYTDVLDLGPPPVEKILGTYSPTIMKLNGASFE